MGTWLKLEYSPGKFTKCPEISPTETFGWQSNPFVLLTPSPRPARISKILLVSRISSESLSAFSVTLSFIISASVPSSNISL